MKGGSEECDDGNQESKDGCSNECFIEEGWICDQTCEEICGDGIRVGSEICDDGN